MDYNFNAMCYYKSALDLSLPAKLCPEIDGFELTLGKNHYFFSGVLTPFNAATSDTISQNKLFTNTLLSRNKIPTPKARVIHRSEYTNGELEHIIACLTFPLVIKPLDRGLGQGVICNIKTLEQLKILLNTYLPHYESLMIEEFHGNLHSYRVLVFNGQVIGVLQITPAHVYGDGQHTVQELIDLTNQERTPINLYLNLGHIHIDEECQTLLNEQGITLDFIPAQGQKILLGYSGRGGSYESIDTNICRKNKKLMIKVAQVTGLNFVGIDVECEHINTPIEYSKGVIIETNHNPNIRMHETPVKGKPNCVSLKMMRSLIYQHPIAYLVALGKKFLSGRI